MSQAIQGFTLQEHWLKDIRHLLSPNRDPRPDPEDVSLLVIHAISLPPYHFGGDYISHLFCNSLHPRAHPLFADLAQVKVSSHFLIDRPGSVQQYVPVNERAWHAGVCRFAGRENCNDYSIGIELEGDEHTPFTDQQYDRLALLIGCLMQRYTAITKDRIVGHADVAPGRKIDPGPYFDWARLHQKLVI